MFYQKTMELAVTLSSISHFSPTLFNLSPTPLNFFSNHLLYPDCCALFTQPIHTPFLAIQTFLLPCPYQPNCPPVCHLVRCPSFPLCPPWSSKSLPISVSQMFQKPIEGFDCKVNGKALAGALQHSLGVSKAAEVSVGSDLLTLGKKCCHSCDTYFNGPGEFKRF